MVEITSSIKIARMLGRPHMMLPGLIALIVLFDQIITYGLSAILGRGGGAGALILIFVTLGLAKHRINGFGIFLFVLGACAISFQVNALSPNQLYTATIAILLLYIACSQAKLPIPQTKIFLIALWFILFFKIFSLAGIDFFEFISRIEVNRRTGLYSEPSHLSYYVVILYYFSIKANPGNERRNAVPALLLLFLNFSLSALLPLLLILMSAAGELNRSRKRWVTSAGVVLFALLLAFKADYIAERNIFTPADEQSATSQVLLYYYSAFFHFVEHNRFIGFGPDMFFDAYKSYADSTFPIFGDLNSTDGSFLLVKLTGELGLATAFVLLFAICRRLRRESNAVLLIFLQYVLLRGFGITSAIPVSLLLLTMVITHSYACKR